MSLEGKTEAEIHGLEDQLISKLEEKGNIAGNISLIRELEWSDDIYWHIRNELVDAGRLALGKGKGGSVKLVPPPLAEGQELAEPTTQAGTEVLVPEARAKTETDLYEPLATVLRDQWSKDSRFRESLVEITAKQGRRDTGGKWTRPDLTVIGMSTYVYVPGRHFDVATFEVKPSYEIDVTAVYEALAHRRAATRAYVIFHVTDEQHQDSRVCSTLDQISEEAKRHGIGVIVVTCPDDYETWDERVEAIRTSPDPERLNEFLAVQLSEGAKQEIVQWFK